MAAVEHNGAGGERRRRLPDFKQSVKLKYVKLGYSTLINNAAYLILAPLAVLVAVHLSTFTPADLADLWAHFQYNLLSVVLCSSALAFAAAVFFLTRPTPVYLVDFACYKPPPARRCSRAEFLRLSAALGAFTPANLDFQRKIIERSGLGDDTYIPEAISSVPMSLSMASARAEAKAVMFGALDDLFAKTGCSPKDVGVVVVNCSLFNPTPSLSAMVINKYKMRSNVRSYNLGGMGCSAGLIAVDLAKDILRAHRGTAVVISLESITLNWYFGNDRSMLLSNCLFRLGGAAVLLSSRRRDRRRSKYELVHTVRTNKAADDRSFNCVYQREDADGKTGVALAKEVMAVAGDALKTNITTLGPLVLPLSEQLLFFATLAGRRLLKIKALKPYIPDFKLAFEHVCIHAGGRAVLDEIEKNLGLSEWHLEPSRMTLHRFGNTSSSSLWYELAYTEAKGRVRRRDRVWQIAFGSGFKCNSAVWRALRSVNPATEKTNPWADEIGRFPVPVPTVSPIVEAAAAADDQ